MWRSIYISLLIAGILTGCGDDANPDPVVPSKTYFISATPVSEVSAETLKAYAQLTGLRDFTSMMTYGVKTYKIVYETTYNGEPVTASGLLYMPQGLGGKAPLLSLQHGTTFIKEDAPSTSGEFTGMEFFASAGYIAIMPDFIGYGESAELFHPYYDEPHSASAVIDMIKSAKEFLTEEEIGFTDQLFLAGYSEGGYVTLAAAKAIETDPSHGLTVTAVAAGAGGYDLNEMLRNITTGTHYSYPSYLAFVLMSYNNTYGWNKPLTYFFQDQYAAALTTYMNGEYGGSTINSKLTTVLADLLDPDFYSRLKTEEGEPELKQAPSENSVSGWSTSLPIRLYHGTNDEIIPYHNSEVTLENFNAAGSDHVTLTAIPNGTHGSSFIPMIQLFVPWFETLR
jgi:pimeloyl-ACP methyl ester carboxylesterase